MYLGLGMTISSIGNDVLIAREGGGGGGKRPINPTSPSQAVLVFLSY